METKKDVSKFNFWASKPKDIQPTRTVQDVTSTEKTHRKLRRIEFAAICQSGPCD